MLQRMPPIEVFAGIESLRSGSEGISSGLPTRAELQKWLVEHDRIEKETEIFDVGEFRKLKKFTKGAVHSSLDYDSITEPFLSRCTTESFTRGHGFN